MARAILLSWLVLLAVWLQRQNAIARRPLVRAADLPLLLRRDQIGAVSLESLRSAFLGQSWNMTIPLVHALRVNAVESTICMHYADTFAAAPTH